jgi:hypothetical protein
MNFGFRTTDVHGNNLTQAEVPVFFLGYGCFLVTMTVYGS